MLKKSITVAVAALLLTALVACSSNDKKEEAEASEKQLYDIAQKQLTSNNYTSAVSNLQLLESRYPFGAYAEQAQLEIIYAYYRSYETEAAIAAAERFIRLHPQHPNIDYAYYLKGLASYSQGKGLFERFLPTDMTRRDPGAARQSFNDFAQLLARFPNSEYVPDARARMVNLRNQLARYEIHVANYYFKRGAYLAAANRGRYVVENFQKSTAIPDALAVMCQAYQLLGLDDLAEDSREVLASNYPQHPALNKDGSFKTAFNPERLDRSWVNRLSFGLFDRNEPLTFDYRP